jgi:hypothetical protein
MKKYLQPYLQLLYFLLLLYPIYGMAEEKKFDDWTAVSSIKDGNNYCYAYVTPYRTKVFTGVRDQPYLLIVNKGYKEFSIGVSPGFYLSKTKGFVIKTDSRAYLMDVRVYENAITFSSAEDVSIINGMIKDGRYVEVRSYSGDDNDKVDLAADYYSLKGFTRAMQFLSKCPL